ncbi:MAG: alpha/beta hydrolase, partial [Alphaproteobacteria bacterium]|nr:alpha/beta hydrolase [Alphaproteobacteria bacterium]
RGQSDWLRDPSHYHQAQYLADINALLARLNVRQVDWIGTSLGGLLGIVLAAQPNTPIRRLVLNDAGPFVPLASLQRIAMYVGIDPIFASQTQVEAWYRQVYSLSGPFSDDDYIHLARHGSRQRPNGTFGLGYDPSISLNFNALATDINLWPLYQMITCPTMVIRGEISDVLPEPVAKLMTESGPRAVLHTIPHIGHVPGLCDAHQISLIEQFLGL